MSRQVVVSTLITDQFSLYTAPGGFTKVSNEPPGNFTVTTYLNGADNAATITLAEIGTSLGEWTATWTPDTVGFWVIEIVNATYNHRTKLEYDVGTALVTGANRPPASGT